jgi:hypothetical protein
LMEFMSWRNFGTNLAMSADGTVVVGAALAGVDPETATMLGRHVRAYYRYVVAAVVENNNATNDKDDDDADRDEGEWQALLLSPITSNGNYANMDVLYPDVISLSPPMESSWPLPRFPQHRQVVPAENSTLCASLPLIRTMILRPMTITTMLRMLMLILPTNDSKPQTVSFGTKSARILPVRRRPIPPFFGHALSLTDNLVLAVSDDSADTTSGESSSSSSSSTTSATGMVHVMKVDEYGAWVRLGQQAIQNVAGNSLKLAHEPVSNTMRLAVGGWKRVRTFRYNSESDTWLQYGSDLFLDADPIENNSIDADQNQNSSSSNNALAAGVLVDMSSDGTMLALGMDVYGGGRRVQVFTYSASDNNNHWRSMSNNVQGDDGLSFGHFALSANGKVLATTTHQVTNNSTTNNINDSSNSSMPNYDDSMGQIRIWDCIVAASSDGEEATNVVNDVNTDGEWIQRSGPPIQLGLPGSRFGWKVALSADGSRLATSATRGMNKEGVSAGKIRVFELLLDTTNASSS